MLSFTKNNEHARLLTLLTLLCPPVTYLRITGQIHVPACWKNLTFPNYEFGKGQYAFYPIKSRFSEKKNNVPQNTKISWGGPLTTWVKRLSSYKIFQKSNIIFEGSRHPNLLNHSKYDKSFHNKSFPKRIETPTPPNPKIFRGGTMCPLPRSLDTLI